MQSSGVNRRLTMDEDSCVVKHRPAETVPVVNSAPQSTDTDIPDLIQPVHVKVRIIVPCILPFIVVKSCLNVSKESMLIVAK